MQSIVYDMWYYKLGINTNTHLQNVRMVKVNTIFYPKGTVLHWNKGIEVATNIVKNSPYLSNLETAIVNTNIDYYPGYEGKLTIRNILKETIIKENSKLEPSFRFIRNNQKLYVTPTTPIIEDYCSIHSKYKYMVQPLLRYIKYKNVVSTIYLNLNNHEGRRDFIFLDIPKDLPNRNELNRYSQVLNKTYLENLPTYKHLNVLDLWMYLNPETKSKSMLSKIKNIDNVDLIIGNDTDCVITNLAYLNYMVTENLPSKDYKNKIGSYPYSTASKLLLRILYTINGMSVPDEENDVLTKDEIIENIGDSNVEEVNESLDNNNTEESDIEEDEALDDNVEETTNSKNVTTTLNTVKKQYQNTEEMNTPKKNLVDIQTQLDILADNKVISNHTYNNLASILEEQYFKPSALDPKVPLMEMLNTDNDDYSLDIDNTTHNVDKTMFNPNDSKTVVKGIKDSYLSKQYDKDITRVIYSLQNAGIIVEEHKVEKKENILGGTVDHVLRVRSITGGASNIVRVTLPVVGKNGIIKKDGNHYVIRHLQTDLPIRKIDYNVVELSSHYGKVFITKGNYSYDNIGNWILNKLSKHESVFDLIPGNVNTMDVVLPKLYNMFSRATKSFRVGESRYSFIYSSRFNLFSKYTKEQLLEIENRTKTVIVGVSNEQPIFIDYKDNFYILQNNKLIPMDNPLDTLGIDLSEGPIEYATINIFKKNIPIAILLAYHLGLEELMNLIGAKYIIIDNTRQLLKDGKHYSIQFLDKIYSIERDYGKCDLILSGLNKLNQILKTVSCKSLEDKNEFGILSTLLELKNIHMTEFKLLDSMFVDPMTMSVLKLMKEPLTFLGLLIRSAELLVDDNYKNPNDIQYSIIQGYDRIAGMLYKRLVEGVKEYENRTAKNKLALTIPPYDVMNRIFEDSTTVSLDDINPMAGIKQTEDVSRVGHGGRGKDGMARSTRILDETWMGVISEATKDSTDVGITAYLSANPNLSNTRGMTKSLDPKNTNWSNLISSANMLAPFILTDDTKRIN